ncbi:MAG: hypothetical protein HC819_20020 [Cyclobacteriaceae bacterium]|nr:hypothetical protein [Cyclobacteriaceae bacterium]
MSVKIGIYITFFVLMLSNAVKAQDDAITAQDSVKDARKQITFYASPVYRIAQFASTSASFGGVAAGISINKQIDIGFSYSIILNDFEKKIIFPTSHNYAQRNTEMSIHYVFTACKIRPLAGVSLSLTEAIWSNDAESVETYRDFFFNHGGYGGLDWSINKYLTFLIKLGYTVSQDVELIGFEREDFNGFDARFELRINIGK